MCFVTKPGTNSMFFDIEHGVEMPVTRELKQH
jgi:hypothetical protein